MTQSVGLIWLNFIPKRQNSKIDLIQLQLLKIIGTLQALTQINVERMLLAAAILISAFLLNLFLPWWSIAIPGLIFGYVFNKKALVSFGLGFLALFLLWGGQALYIHLANDAILSTRIAEMLSVGSPIIVVLVTGILGGLVSGLAALTGSLVKETPSSRKFS
ncbi:hypothetical protein [Gracilimonas amylolytica]|uniref:hypothetical protein n=1 Tax=Gracilimonas amylolytica TaxID=1749045 RepID=UPI001E324728|nr:hypothetical protein [Gracilimonas amylolytica]